MEARYLHIKVENATNLKSVTYPKLKKMAVYVAVSISGDPKTEQRTPVDKDGGTNPTWDQEMRFTIDELAAQAGRLTLVFRLWCHRRFGDIEVGQVHVLVKGLLGNIGDFERANRPVVSHGELIFSHKCGEKFNVDNNQPPTPPKRGGDSPRQRGVEFFKWAANKLGLASCEALAALFVGSIVGCIHHAASNDDDDDDDDDVNAHK